MQPRVTVHDAAMRLEGPLLFMRRTLEVGLNEAVVVSGRDGAPRLGRVAAIDFADASNGWAVGNSLMHTNDGHGWHMQ